MTTADEPATRALPVYLVEWVVPRQRRDPQKAAATVGTGSLVQLVRTMLAELHSRLGSVELGDFTPLVQWANGDLLEDVTLKRTESSWDRVNRLGSVHYSLEHATWPQPVLLAVTVRFCPGCHGRGGAHAEGCWASDKPAAS